MERAKEIHEFCGNNEKTITMAVYASNGNVTTYPGACVVIQPMCSGAPVYSGIFLDKQANSSKVCMDRASHWAMVCDNEPEFKTTMKFTSTGETKSVKGTKMAVPETAGFKEVPQNHVTLKAQSLASTAGSLLDKLAGNGNANAGNEPAVLSDDSMRFKEAETQAVPKGPILFDEEDDEDDEEAPIPEAPKAKEAAPAPKAAGAPPAWLVEEQFSTPTFED